MVWESVLRWSLCFEVFFLGGHSLCATRVVHGGLTFPPELNSSHSSPPSAWEGLTFPAQNVSSCLWPSTFLVLVFPSILWPDRLPGLIVCLEFQVERYRVGKNTMLHCVCLRLRNTNYAIVARSKWRERERKKRPLKFTVFKNNLILIPHVCCNSHSGDLCDIAVCCGFLSWLSYCSQCAGFTERDTSCL